MGRYGYNGQVNHGHIDQIKRNYRRGLAALDYIEKVGQITRADYDKFSKEHYFDTCCFSTLRDNGLLYLHHREDTVESHYELISEDTSKRPVKIMTDWCGRPWEYTDKRATKAYQLNNGILVKESDLRVLERIFGKDKVQNDFEPRWVGWGKTRTSSYCHVYAIDVEQANYYRALANAFLALP